MLIWFTGGEGGNMGRLGIRAGDSGGGGLIGKVPVQGKRNFNFCSYINPSMRLMCAVGLYRRAWILPLLILGI